MRFVLLKFICLVGPVLISESAGEKLPGPDAALRTNDRRPTMLAATKAGPKESKAGPPATPEPTAKPAERATLERKSSRPAYLFM